MLSSKTDSKSLCFSCKSLTTDLASSLNIESSFSMLIGSHKTEIGNYKYYPIITKSAK